MPENLINTVTPILKFWIAVAALMGVCFGWFVTAFRAGQKTQKLLNALDRLQADFNKNAENLSKVHERLDKFERAIGRLEGKTDK